MAHVAVTPGDVITHINDAAVEDMRAELARPGFKTGPVLLTLRRHTLPVPPIPLRSPRVLEQPPSKTQMRKLVGAANDIQTLVCCRCKHHTFRGGLYTQGQWALWHLDRRHRSDPRLLEGLWSQVAFPQQCALAAEIAEEEEWAKTLKTSGADQWVDTVLRVGAPAALRSALFIQAQVLRGARRPVRPVPAGRGVVDACFQAPRQVEPCSVSRFQVEGFTCQDRCRIKIEGHGSTANFFKLVGQELVGFPGEDALYDFQGRFIGDPASLLKPGLDAGLFHCLGDSFTRPVHNDGSHADRFHEQDVDQDVVK